MFRANTLMVGDFENGDIYTFAPNYYADDEETQKWVRSWRALPPDANNLNRTSHHSLKVAFQTGVGLDGPTLLANGNLGADPQVMLRWSDDGGHTWSNEHWMSMGRIGERREVKWSRLGTTRLLRDRVYEISGTDPVKVAIMGAELVITKNQS